VETLQAGDGLAIMVSAIFTTLMLGYYLLILRRRGMQNSVLAFALWGLYFSLGLAGILGEASGSISPVFPINIAAPLALFVVVAACTSAFLRFDGRRLQSLQVRFPWQRSVENGLMAIQVYSIAFFLPFVRDSLTGDPHLNRLYIDDKMAAMGEYGLLNTLASAGAHLFVPSMVFALLRISPTKEQGRNVGRAAVLFLCSLSYVFYVLAYVGRDGVVYWSMMAALLIALFWPYFLGRDRVRVIRLVGLLLLVILIPFANISISRFLDVDQGGMSPFFEYFGAQIANFSDYSSMDRPVTHGAISFPLFYEKVCLLVATNCEPWVEIRPSVFEEYLMQGKAPWLFGTFLSDFAADFGFGGSVAILLFFAVLCAVLCARFRRGERLTISRFLMIVFLFQIPYWGVFYFRFATINAYLVNNLAFILVLASLQSFSYNIRCSGVTKPVVSSVK
jgi:hypothetical protein